VAERARPRVAVVGCGHLGTIHARILAAEPRAELACVVDSDAARAGKLAAELGCAHASDVRGLPPDLDAAVVAVPTLRHEAVAVPLLERGLACLVEKPLAHDLPSADRILAAAERGGALLAVGHVERFQPGLRKVRELGLRPRFIECHRLAPFSFRSTDIGVVHDLMIHDLDLVLELMGAEVTALDAAGGAILTEHEDMASVRLVFAGGGRANVTASRASLQPMRRFRMFSADCYVSLDLHRNYGLLVRKGPGWEAGRARLKELPPEDLAAAAQDLQKDLLEVVELELGGHERPLQAELASFLDSVARGTPPEVGGAAGRAALALAQRIRDAIRAEAW
jgi:predicted dehydrogenase